MIAELAMIALATLVGWSLTRRISTAFLAGCGVLSAILFVAAIVHLPWSRATLLVPCAFLGFLGFLRVPRVPRAIRDCAEELRGTARNPRNFVVLLASAILLLGYSLYATAAPPPEFDFLADWGAKGRVFFEAGTIDWGFLETASYRATHPDYPLLLPLLFDAVAVLRGGWSDDYLGLINAAFAVSTLLVVHEVTKDAFIVFAVVPLAAAPWIGIAEGPFIAFATAALLLIRRGETSAGAVMLGLAAFTKNEGLALIVAVAIGLLIARRAREIVRLWPAVAIAAPWLILRAMHDLPTDVAKGGVIERVVTHLRDPQALATAFAAGSPGKPLFWIGVAVAVVIVARRLIAEERFILAAIVIQFAFYVAAYLATPHDVVWHVRWSWERLVAHLTPALAVTLLSQLLDKRQRLY